MVRFCTVVLQIQLTPSQRQAHLYVFRSMPVKVSFWELVYFLQEYHLQGLTQQLRVLDIWHEYEGACVVYYSCCEHLEFYQADELAYILKRSANLLGLDCDNGTVELIASRSRGTPRIANRLLKRVRDYAQVKGSGRLTDDIVQSALKMEQIDELGLDELDRSFLRALINVYDGGPAGIEAIAATLGEERDTLEDVVEPYLLQVGFVRRTKRGREVTQSACEHLGLAYKGISPKSGLFDNEE